MTANSRLATVTLLEESVIKLRVPHNDGGGILEQLKKKHPNVSLRNEDITGTSQGGYQQILV